MEKRFNLFLTDDLHKEIKIKATLEGKSMNELILDAVKRTLDNKPQKAKK